jgi:protein-S-isoprenylcysteine O-methyltransferase Ste14
VPARRCPIRHPGDARGLGPGPLGRAFPRPEPDAAAHPENGATRTESGAYRYARHPIYGGLLLAAAGWSLRRQSVTALLLTAGLGGLFMAKSRFEEAALTRRFAEYPAYRRRVRQFLPGVW